MIFFPAKIIYFKINYPKIKSIAKIMEVMSKSNN